MDNTLPATQRDSLFDIDESDVPNASSFDTEALSTPPGEYGRKVKTQGN